MGDGDGMKQAVQLPRPEIEKLLQLGEMRVQVVLLPDVGLQDSGMIGHSVQDVGGRQTEPFELPTEVWAHHAVSPKLSRAMLSPATPLCNGLFRKESCQTQSVSSLN